MSSGLSLPPPLGIWYQAQDVIGHATAVQTPHRLVVQVLQQVVIVQGFQVFGNLRGKAWRERLRGQPRSWRTASQRASRSRCSRASSDAQRVTCLCLLLHGLDDGCVGVGHRGHIYHIRMLLACARKHTYSRAAWSFGTKTSSHLSLKVSKVHLEEGVPRDVLRGNAQHVDVRAGADKAEPPTGDARSHESAERGSKP